MPRFDGTGPLGLGPGTGWGLGPCGAGRAFGRRLGWRRFSGYLPVYIPNKTKEKEILSEDAKVLEEELKAIKARLAELEGEK